MMIHLMLLIKYVIEKDPLKNFYYVIFKKMMKN